VTPNNRDAAIATAVLQVLWPRNSALLCGTPGVPLGGGLRACALKLCKAQHPFHRASLQSLRTCLAVTVKAGMQASGAQWLCHCAEGMRNARALDIPSQTRRRCERQRITVNERAAHQEACRDEEPRRLRVRRREAISMAGLDVQTRCGARNAEVMLEHVIDGLIGAKAEKDEHLAQAPARRAQTCR
jgi:hypothetical protein